MFSTEKLRDFVSSHLPYLKKVYNYFLGPKRYQYLFQCIQDSRCRKVMEIGTWDGLRAEQMIKTAKKIHGSSIEYYGFDLFEDFDNLLHGEKLGTKKAPSMGSVKNRLSKTGCSINLFKGDSVKILPQVINSLPKMDMIFIDGGHNIETIQNDWFNIQPLIGLGTIVIFDDYWNRDDVGCKFVVENISSNEYLVEILPIQDSFKKDWGILKINFVKVTRK